MNIFGALEIAGFNVGVLAIPIVAIFIVIALVVTIKVVASRYVKVGPDEIAVFSGRRYKYKAADGTMQDRGFYILQGGGKILLPIVEKVEIIKIGAFQVSVEETNVPNKDNVGVTVKGIATCKLSMAEADLANAVSNFLDKDEDERIKFIANILKGHVRSIVGNLNIDQLLRERQKLNEQVVNESTPECKRIGIEVINLVIQDVRDEVGYIASLGKRQVAEALRDAQVSTAEAEKDTAIRVSSAKREAAEVSAQNETKVAEAQKLRDVQIANFKQETETKRAVAETAFDIAKTAQEETLQVLQAKRDKAATEARAEVQQAEAVRRQAELQATTITTATIEQQASVIKAEAGKKVALLNAETATIAADGKKNALIKEGEGEAQKTEITAAATARATKLTLTAEAEGNQATLLAQAEGRKQLLLAEAEGTRASTIATAEGKERLLIAEALGANNMAEALQKLSPQGQLILILDRLPLLLDKGGDAGEKIMKAVFGELGKSMEKIGSIQITDLGGGAGAQKGLAAIGGIIPQLLTQFYATAKASGIDPTDLLKVLKIDPAHLAKLVSAPLVPTEAGKTETSQA